ncbi:MAG: serpin family protein [Candidatus Parabeggiatoa sp. nov. 2]|nr:MAG: serpin family protein [Gammaproteobacteria bacterium]
MLKRLRLKMGLAIIFACVFLMLGPKAWAQAEDNTAFELIDQVVKGNTTFALDLYARLIAKGKSDNLFFSPYSLSTALAMTYAGAGGRTATQMSKVLHFPEEQAELHTAFYHLQNDVNDAAKKASNLEIRIANAFWGQKGYPFLENFKDSVENYYQAKLKEVDFRTAYQTIRKEINAWVEEQTNKKIKNLIKPGLIDHLTRLVLVNAIYFKGNWASPFKTGDTKKASFWVTSTKDVRVPMMTQKNHFGYTENRRLQVQVLELPYGGNSQDFPSYGDNNISMIVLLPRQRNGLAKLEKSLKGKNLEQWLDNLQWRQKVKVFLPKFKISTGFNLSKTLASMGMPDAFNENADFSGIDGVKELHITSIVHKAFVDVNEKGTEAAAATGVMIGTRGLPPPTPEFRADHPFIFLIRHNSTKSILFMGRVVNPLKK